MHGEGCTAQVDIYGKLTDPVEFSVAKQQEVNPTKQGKTFLIKFKADILVPLLRAPV
jgi:hypothetical protein